MDRGRLPSVSALVWVLPSKEAADEATHRLDSKTIRRLVAKNEILLWVGVYEQSHYATCLYTLNAIMKYDRVMTLVVKIITLAGGRVVKERGIIETLQDNIMLVAFWNLLLPLAADMLAIPPGRI